MVVIVNLSFVCYFLEDLKRVVSLKVIYCVFFFLMLLVLKIISYFIYFFVEWGYFLFNIL